MEKRKQKSKECNPRRAGSVHNKKKKNPSDDEYSNKPMVGTYFLQCSLDIT